MGFRVDEASLELTRFMESRVCTLLASRACGIQDSALDQPSLAMKHLSEALPGTCLNLNRVATSTSRPPTNPLTAPSSWMACWTL